MLNCTGCNQPKIENAFSKASGSRYPKRNGYRHRCKSCEYEYQTKITRTLKEQIFDKFGHKCIQCGFEDKRALQIDHIDGGGNQEHLEIPNTHRFYRKVLDDTDNKYQILCANCNWIKRAERNENPVCEAR